MIDQADEAISRIRTFVEGELRHLSNDEYEIVVEEIGADFGCGDSR